MSITFAQLKTRLGHAVLRDDLEPEYGDYLNEALREIQNRRSWIPQKRMVFVTIPTGGGHETVALPTDFKELQGRQAVQYMDDAGGLTPAEVVTEEQQSYRVWAFGGTPICTWPPRVFFERQAGAATLGVLEPVSSPFLLRVKYFCYLPDLSADLDQSALANLYPKMVLAKAKAIAFTEINDDIAVASEQEFEKKLAEAIRQEAYSEVRGLTTRM